MNRLRTGSAFSVLLAAWLTAACAGGRVNPLDCDTNLSAECRPDGGVEGGMEDASHPSDSSDAASPLDGATCHSSPAPNPDAKYLSKPATTEVPTTDGFTLHMELNAFPAYGAADGAADILYTGETGAWTFSVPPVKIKSVNVVASMVSDDHTNAQTYSYQMWSGTCSYDSPTPLPHGSPLGGPFTNWMQVGEPGPSSTSDLTVTIANTGATTLATDWIAVDWIELRIATE